MGNIKKNKFILHKGHKNRWLSVLLVCNILINGIVTYLIPVYAADTVPVAIDVGREVTAVLNDGILTLSGQGPTDDFSAETAPFLDYSRDIHTLVIEDGISYIGSCLFYGLGSLKGELILPGSIIGFGDYAFSGADIENAPKFTVIRNEFKSAEIMEDVQQDNSGAEDTGEGSDTGAGENADGISDAEPDAGVKESTGSDAEEETAQKAQAEEDGVEEGADATWNQDMTEGSSDEPDKAAEGVPGTGAAPDEDAVPSPSVYDSTGLSVSQNMGSSNVSEEPDEVQSEIIFQQEIENPETLFFQGQTGFALCETENKSFSAGAGTAGYQVSDTSVTLLLDEKKEIELPLTNGQICLPECPKEFSEIHEEDEFYTYEFAGWSKIKDDTTETVLTAGEYMGTDGAEHISLYSVWKPSGKYELKAEAETQDKTAVYSVVDSKNENGICAPAGYTFTYQWQMAEKEDADALVWNDIEGAKSAVYKRAIETADERQQFRCKVTAVKLSRAREASGEVILYSESVDGQTDVCTVYVAQSTGKDNDAGTEAAPLQTLTKAAETLQEKNLGGTVETNKIVLMEDYVMEDSVQQQEKSGNLFGGVQISATITGKTKDIKLRGGAIVWVAGGDNNKIDDNISDATINLSGDICLEKLQLPKNHHIYGNGNNITIGENVTSTSTFLYGAERSKLEDKAGKIVVKSGSFSRVLGYMRSTGKNVPVDVRGIKASIQVSGNAHVNELVAGCASGGISNADVDIIINGNGDVDSLIGGNQGYSNTNSAYTGKTSIHVTDSGKVDNIYSAGTGRAVSIPTFKGNMDIKVDESAAVGNIYGAGSAAYVISGNSEQPPSSINMEIKGGTVGNIFAAGKGGDSLITKTVTVTGGTEEINEGLVKDFGSLTGDVTIHISDNANITGNIYASGEGYTPKSGEYSSEHMKKNAYLNGNVTIQVKGGIVKGNIYGGGKGIAKEGYEECARVKQAANVKVQIEGGTIGGSVFGGGSNGKVEGNTEVAISGGTVNGNVYGGSEYAVVNGKTTIEITNGTVVGSVYGGSLGEAGKRFVLGGATVNMSGGWIQGNLYGGSENSDDGPAKTTPVESPKDLVFVNLTGGIVKGNVFGGGYLGEVNGSTHLHIGVQAPDKCSYYKANPDEKPKLEASPLHVEGSVYAGGDYGGEGAYDKITITGTSHVYVDGNGYDTANNDSTTPTMDILGGVFGSGASCDAGSTRLVTLDHYGTRTGDLNAENIGTTRTLAAIQRADRVLLINSHVRLTGQSDIANTNQTALYSLNHIGDPEKNLSDLGNGLVLQDGSTVILDSEAIELARFSSVDKDGKKVEKKGVKATSNVVSFGAGTVLRIAYTNPNNSALTYGEISGYSYMLAGDTADAYAYARIKTVDENGTDGDFVNTEGEEIESTNVPDKKYRYWKTKVSGGVAERETVLTAQSLKEGNEAIDGEFSVVTGTIELPPTSEAASYTIKNVTLPNTLTLVEAARKGKERNSWVTTAYNKSGDSTDSETLEKEQKRILENPLNCFGLFIEAGTGFTNAGLAYGKVISTESVKKDDKNTVIGEHTTETEKNVIPQINFHLTYSNAGITVSKSLGEVIIVLQDDKGKEINMSVEIVTKANVLSDQEIDLYATQSGGYKGKLTIPSGESRTLSLTGVNTEGVSDNFVSYDANDIIGNQFAINMKPIKSQGWSTTGLMEDYYDVKRYESGKVSIGTTDSRFEAAIEFNLKNAEGFEAKENSDKIILTLGEDGEETATQITLNIHWKKSIVSEVRVAAGKQYDGISDDSTSAVVSQKSGVTSQYILNDTASMENLWLELRVDSTENAIALPAGTQMILLKDNTFYTYQVEGAESNNRIQLSDFKEMWGTGSPTGNVAVGDKHIVIMDFSTGAGLSPGKYSLRLRNETSADAQTDSFTVDNSSATLKLNGTGGMSRGEYAFTLKAVPFQDTRITEGGYTVLSPEAENAFPIGTVFKYQDTTGAEIKCYPRGGKVYLPLAGGEYGFTMDTTDSTGLAPGDYTLNAEWVPDSISAGAGTVGNSAAAGKASVSVTDNPVYALSVKLKDGYLRVVEAGKEMKFTAQYAVPAGASSTQIGTIVEEKINGTYIGTDWGTSSNTTTSDSGSLEITMTIPQGCNPGTYRIWFTLADLKVPYNIIVK